LRAAAFEERYRRLYAAVRAKDQKALESLIEPNFCIFTVKRERKTGGDAFRDGIINDIGADPRSSSQIISISEANGITFVTRRSSIESEGTGEADRPKRASVVWEDLWSQQKSSGLWPRSNWVLFQRAQAELEAILGSGKRIHVVRPPDPEPPEDGVDVVAKLWEHIEPYARGDRYEDPLQKYLVAEGIGVVTGGGTQLRQDRSIEFVNVDLSISNVEQNLPKVAAELTRLGAPKDSELRYEIDGTEHVLRFGRLECVAIFLDGVNLPKHVYEIADVNEVISRLNAAVTENSLGEFRAHWEGPRETGLFFYGDDAAAMHRAMVPVFEREPLCQNARVVERYGRHSESTDS
jgi:hypothetical protein